MQPAAGTLRMHCAYMEPTCVLRADNPLQPQQKPHATIALLLPVPFLAHSSSFPAQEQPDRDTITLQCKTQFRYPAER
jgi:hypothetical protein